MSNSASAICTGAPYRFIIFTLTEYYLLTCVEAAPRFEMVAMAQAV